MLMLASLPRSYKPLVQTLLVGRTTLKLDKVTTTLKENERMMKDESIDKESHVLGVQRFE